jgi:hypothetical protein
MARQEYEDARRNLLSWKRIAGYIALVSKNIPELEKCAISSLSEARKAYSEMKRILREHADFAGFNRAHINLCDRLVSPKPSAERQ